MNDVIEAPEPVAGAEDLIGVEAAIGLGDWAFEADDWYEAMAILLAERAPA